MNFVWNDAAVAKLRELFNGNYSSSEIARALGIPSRNAVIGKINRMGWRREKKLDEWRKNKPSPKCGKPYAIAPRSRIKAGYTDLEERFAPYLPPEPQRPDTMANCSLMELTSKTCRFPIGDPRDPDFHFCGNEIAGEGVVYCHHHMQIAYITAAQRRAARASNEGEPYYGT